MATGTSVMQYVRERRLTEAARSLASGAPDILTVALVAGYDSHEAFTRAFRDQFGLAPELLRAQGNVNNLELKEPLRMETIEVKELEKPRIEISKPLLLAGLSERYVCGAIAGIPGQWQRFAPSIGYVPGQLGHTTYGACYNFDNAEMDYLCGVEVSGFEKLSAEWSRLSNPAQKYAMFVHRGHISGIASTWFNILNKWLPELGHKTKNGPQVEVYSEKFNPMSGTGEVEIWIPIKD
jgi:AraC family transcriptional regulator